MSTEFKLAAIAYPPEYEKLISEFHKLQEPSADGLIIMEKIIEDYNPAHYSIWKRRWEFIVALKYDLKKELNWITFLLMENPKTYQIWNYRQKIITLMNDPADELLTVTEILQDDSKNYHAWAYRQWVIKKFELFDGELEYTTLLLQQDVYNNSAWNQRYFLLSMGKVNVEEEIYFVKERISSFPDNESVWNYYRGIIKWNAVDPSMDDFNFVKSFLPLVFAYYTLFLWSNQEEKKIYLEKLSEIDAVRSHFWKNYPI